MPLLCLLYASTISTSLLLPFISFLKHRQPIFPPEWEITFHTHTRKATGKMILLVGEIRRLHRSTAFPLCAITASVAASRCESPAVVTVNDVFLFRHSRMSQCCPRFLLCRIRINLHWSIECFVWIFCEVLLCQRKFRRIIPGVWFLHSILSINRNWCVIDRKLKRPLGETAMPRHSHQTTSL
jgi:hypothetical protein